MTVAGSAGPGAALRGSLETPEPPSGTLRLQQPPPLTSGDGLAGLLMNVVPMLGSLGSIVLVATTPSQDGSGGSARQYVSAGMFLFASLGFVLVQVSQQRKQRQRSVTGSRTGYLRYLRGVRQAVREAADEQRRALTWHHPDPSSLPAVAAEGSRLWGRRPGDPRFLQVRYGVRRQPLSVELLGPEDSAADEPDPACASALHRLLVAHRLQPDLPAALDLSAVDRVEICGSQEHARAAARSLVCAATSGHAPEHLIVAVLAEDPSQWDWVKWLPVDGRTRAPPHGRELARGSRRPAARRATGPAPPAGRGRRERGAARPCPVRRRL